jgi:hypothetical protein
MKDEDDAPKSVTERKKVGNQRDQPGRNLIASAEGGATGAQAAASPALLRPPSTRADAIRSTQSLVNVPPCYTCKVRLKVAIFFDGTGNNLDADIGTLEHSNVARLFRSHPDKLGPKGIYRIYVPGLGTYFPDIGDAGDDDGMAFGKYGEPRLQWAMDKIDEFVANHPVANITGLDISLFGFSRGAALARAFARRIHKRCKELGTHWQWDKGSFEARLYFMGLFDTVASVGLPASSTVRSLRIAKKWVSLDQGLKNRRQSEDNGLEPVSERINLGIAFGDAPGADPTPGFFDGHGGWADNLRIPSMVLKCLHFFSVHEARNSFPLDSAREGNTQPACVDERWYPGVHSNVGGGYRPGEGGRSQNPDELLSLPALLSMHNAAMEAGVPLLPKTDPRCGMDFETSPALIASYNNYIKVAGNPGGLLHLEGRLLTHRRLLFAWRFKRIHQRGGGIRQDAATIETEEKRYAEERASLNNAISAAEKDPARLAAEQQLKTAEAEHANARANYYAQTRKDWADPSKMEAALTRMKRSEGELAEAKRSFTSADDTRMRLVARRATLGGSGLVGNMNVYDRNLLLDVLAILEMRKVFPRARLRPHYVNLIEAFEAEYVKRKGLLDGHPDVLAFFDNYVHDSLAGFAKDETLPSDPRVVYVGGNRESPFAMRKDERQATTV